MNISAGYTILLTKVILIIFILLIAKFTLCKKSIKTVRKRALSNTNIVNVTYCLIKTYISLKSNSLKKNKCKAIESRAKTAMNVQMFSTKNEKILQATWRQCCTTIFLIFKLLSFWRHLCKGICSLYWAHSSGVCDCIQFKVKVAFFEEVFIIISSYSFCVFWKIVYYAV